jgi:hypothetical protein
MQGASLESARAEIARDQVARTPRPRSSMKALAKAFGLSLRLVKAILLA